MSDGGGVEQAGAGAGVCGLVAESGFVEIARCGGGSSSQQAASQTRLGDRDLGPGLLDRVCVPCPDAPSGDEAARGAQSKGPVLAKSKGLANGVANLVN